MHLNTPLDVEERHALTFYWGYKSVYNVNTITTYSCPLFDIQYTVHTFIGRHTEEINMSHVHPDDKVPIIQLNHASSQVMITLIIGPLPIQLPIITTAVYVMHERRSNNK